MWSIRSTAGSAAPAAGDDAQHVVITYRIAALITVSSDPLSINESREQVAGKKYYECNNQSWYSFYNLRKAGLQPLAKGWVRLCEQQEVQRGVSGHSPLL
jgi:hypothetical protein